MALNLLFGIIAVIYTMLVIMSPTGKECAEAQTYRAWWLKTEIIAFWILFLLYPGPVLPLIFCTKESHDEILNAEDSDDEDDGNAKKGDVGWEFEAKSDEDQEDGDDK